MTTPARVAAAAVIGVLAIGGAICSSSGGTGRRTSAARCVDVPVASPPRACRRRMPTVTPDHRHAHAVRRSRTTAVTACSRPGTSSRHRSDESGITILHEPAPARMQRIVEDDVHRVHVHRPGWLGGLRERRLAGPARATHGARGRSHGVGRRGWLLQRSLCRLPNEVPTWTPDGTAVLYDNAVADASTIPFSDTQDDLTRAG